MYKDFAKLIGDGFSLCASADQWNADKVPFGLFIAIDVFYCSFFFEFLHNEISRYFIFDDPFDLLQ